MGSLFVSIRRRGRARILPALVSVTLMGAAVFFSRPAPAGFFDFSSKPEIEQFFAALGGPFHHRIADFVGFKQDQDKWCWAAVSKTIFRSLTGAQLDQAELARLQFSDEEWNKRYPSAQTWEDVLLPTLDMDCHGASGTGNKCNHGMSTLIALAHVGALLPFREYPRSLLQIYRAVRESLVRGVPVALSMPFPDKNHSLSVYEARFDSIFIQGGTQALRIAFTALDSVDGTVRTLIADLYSPAEQRTEWVGHPVVADYNAKGVRPQACPFLIARDRSKFCR